jgi:putative phosphoesterase
VSPYFPNLATGAKSDRNSLNLVSDFPRFASPDVIAGVRQIAPVTAIRGNVDKGDWAEPYPDTQTARLGGGPSISCTTCRKIRLDPALCGIDVVISGHSHRPRIAIVSGVFYLNPGSAGPQRFKLPVTLATLELTANHLSPLIHHLDCTRCSRRGPFAVRHRSAMERSGAWLRSHGCLPPKQRKQK